MSPSTRWISELE
jgi:hypothetical protein